MSFIILISKFWHWRTDSFCNLRSLGERDRLSLLTIDESPRFLSVGAPSRALTNGVIALIR